MIHLDDSEKKLRKQWLGLLLFIACIEALRSVSFVTQFTSATEVRSTATILGSFGDVFVLLSICVLGNYILYHCAYKNPGIKFLTYTLISSPLAAPIAVCMTGGALIDPSAGVVMKIILSVFLLIYAAAYIMWYVRCLGIRKLNKKIQYQLAYNSEAYTQAKIAFNQAYTLDELQSKYQDAVVLQPSRVVSAIMELYKERKAEIEVLEKATLSPACA